jgi:hypothetical protein
VSQQESCESFSEETSSNLTLVIASIDACRELVHFERRAADDDECFQVAMFALQLFELSGTWG